ncbi:hypothetical protein RA279_27785, partial [Pseudomonas syringae pv. tagetis]|uniref:hypothetical protein n=1 Tax=Pseudomonas syringae group genomosp. 7 TaxID=251699 RepID=UPI00376FBC33
FFFLFLLFFFGLGFVWVSCWLFFSYFGFLSLLGGYVVLLCCGGWVFVCVFWGVVVGVLGVWLVGVVAVAVVVLWGVVVVVGGWVVGLWVGVAFGFCWFFVCLWWWGDVGGLGFWGWCVFWWGGCVVFLCVVCSALCGCLVRFEFLWVWGGRVTVRCVFTSFFVD